MGISIILFKGGLLFGASCFIFYTFYSKGLELRQKHLNVLCSSRAATTAIAKTNEDKVDCQPEQNLKEDVCHSLHNNYTLHSAKATAPQQIFPDLRHPSTPSKWSFYLTQGKTSDYKNECEHIYLTRTGQCSLLLYCDLD